MGQFTQIQQPQNGQPQGKGGPMQQAAQQAQPPSTQSDEISRLMGKCGAITYPGQNGQPRMGKPNNYSNTVGPWDNATIGTQNPAGKGKGA